MSCRRLISFPAARRELPQYGLSLLAAWGSGQLPAEAVTELQVLLPILRSGQWRRAVFPGVKPVV